LAWFKGGYNHYHTGFEVLNTPANTTVAFPQDTKTNNNPNQPQCTPKQQRTRGAISSVRLAAAAAASAAAATAAAAAAAAGAGRGARLVAQLSQQRVEAELVWLVIKLVNQPVRLWVW
jgi:hypothetical protein